VSGALELALAVLAALLLGFVLGRMSAPDPEPPALPPAPPPPPPPPPPSPDRIHIESLNDAALLTRGPLVEAANAAARALFGDRIVGSDLRLTVRHPALLDAVEASAAWTAVGWAGALRVGHHSRTPISRSMALWRASRLMVGLRPAAGS
jgi:two-component system phosphate regulon sensor histidine kinase PhoR